MTHTLGELATRFSVDIQGDVDCHITGVASLKSAQPGQISFFYDKRYINELAASKASAVILCAEYSEYSKVACLITEDPKLLFARIAHFISQEKSAAAEVHPAAIIAASANINPSASIAAGVVIADDVKIGKNAVIGAGCVIARGSIIGNDSQLVANVSIGEDICIGDRVLIHQGAVIGSDGFGFINDAGVWLKVPQLGSVTLGNDVEVGANTTIDRGALDDTVIEEGVKLDNQIQIAHNVHIGAHTAIASSTAIAGSVRIGHHCTIAGKVGITGHLEIADNVHITAMSLVTKSITTAGVYSSSMPAQENKKWNKNVARFSQLDDFAKRMKKIETKIEKSNND